MAISTICFHCLRQKGDFEVCPHCGAVEATKPVQAFHLYPGMVLQNRYVIGPVVGFGGFGITYKVLDRTLNAVVAVKEFFPAGLVSRVPGTMDVVIFSGDRQEQFGRQLERFMEEARNMAKFDQCPHIVKVFDYFMENATAYIVMEFLDGQTLKELMRREGQEYAALSVEKALNIFRPMTEALELIHKKGIVHRDVSPDNIFLTKDGQVKLLDFGAARLSREDKEQTVEAVIKPGFAPPEQYRAKSRLGPFTDIYGLGATLYLMVTGKVPEESVDRQADDQLARPSKLGIKLDSRLEKCVMKSMAVKPELRFQSMKEFRDTVFQEKKVDFPEEELRKRIIRRTLAIVLSSAAMLALIVTVYFQVVNRQGPALSPGTITIWVPVAPEDSYQPAQPGAPEDDGNAADYLLFLAELSPGEDSFPQSGTQAAATQFSMEILAELAEQFSQANDQVDVRLVEVERSGYAAQLEQAARQGELPTLFYTGDSGSGILDYAAELDTLDKWIHTEEYLFLSQYRRLFPSAREVPLAFDIAVVYGNQSAAEYYQWPLPDRIQSLAELAAVGRWGILPGSYGSYMSLYATGDRDAEALGALIDMKHTVADNEIYGDVLWALQQEEYLYVVGGLSDYLPVQLELPGYYSVIPLYDKEAVQGAFRDTWAVAENASRAEREIAMAFFGYLLSDYAQNQFYLQNDSYLPLNRRAFSEYLAIKAADFAYLEGEERNIRFEPEKERERSALGNLLERWSPEDDLPEAALEQAMERAGL